MSKKQIALEMQLARHSTTTDQFTETPRGLTGVATLTKLGLQTGSISWGEDPIRRYGKSTTTTKRKARRNTATHHPTKWLKPHCGLFYLILILRHFYFRPETYHIPSMLGRELHLIKTYIMYGNGHVHWVLWQANSALSPEMGEIWKRNPHNLWGDKQTALRRSSWSHGP